MSVHGVLLVDKPRAVTSHDVVARVRRALRTRRVGHAGTLDPMATGLLLVGVGEALKVLRYLTLSDKRYQARVALGVQTDTLDADGEPEERASVPCDLTIQRVQEVCRGFVGVIRQRAPRYSALKQDGTSLHVRARRGEAVQAPEREVVVHELKVEAVSSSEITLGVHCGSGFYVRSLARDLGIALGTRAHLSALRRTSIGPFLLDDAVTLRELIDAEVKLPSGAMLSIAEAIPQAPRVCLDEVGAGHVRHGRAIPHAHALSVSDQQLHAGAEPVLLCDAQGQLLALGRAEEGHFRVVRGLRARRG